MRPLLSRSVLSGTNNASIRLASPVMASRTAYSAKDPYVGETLSKQEVLDLSRETTMYEWTIQNTMKPIVCDRAKGIYLWDADGKRYMDFNSQLMCTNLGHGDERVNNAILKQLNKVAYVAPTAFTTAARAEAGRLIKEVAPKNLAKAFFTNGGAEANENAIKIARWYTGRQKIAARYRTYHGATAGSIALTGDPRRWMAEPSIPGVVRIPDYYPYRAGKTIDDDEYADEVLRQTEEVLQFEGPHTIAAIIIESVVGTNGLLIPSKRYIQGLRALCTKYGILMIADEVMSGFCRTGEWFACQHWGIEPDMMSMAKGLTSAYVPLGAVMVSKEIADHFDNKPFMAGLTYNSHSVGCAAAIACINAYKDDKILENTRAMGKILKEELNKMKEKHPSIGDVRSIGLFSMIEFVKDRKTRENITPYNPKPTELGPMAPFGAYLRENGIFTFVRWSTAFINPPLIINEQQLREGLAIFDKGIDIIDKAIAK